MVVSRMCDISSDILPLRSFSSQYDTTHHNVTLAEKLYVMLTLLAIPLLEVPRISGANDSIARAEQS
jgi:hypothetical protein